MRLELSFVSTSLLSCRFFPLSSLLGRTRLFETWSTGKIPFWLSRQPLCMSSSNGESRNLSKSDASGSPPPAASPTVRSPNANVRDSTGRFLTTEPKEYSLRARLREEIQNPLRKVRMFIYGGFTASASVGAFISGLRIIAHLLNVAGTQPISETVPNFGINVAVIAVCSFLLRQEVRRGAENLGRLSRGARLATLRIRMPVTDAVMPLGMVRGRKRVVILVGDREGVANCMRNAKGYSKDLEEGAVVVVPYVRRFSNSNGDKDGLIMGSWTADPVGRKEWDAWWKLEESSSFKKRKKSSRTAGTDEPVRVLIIRMDGKVGARSLGPPVWQKLIDEIQKLPARDRYGTP